MAELGSSMLLGPLISTLSQKASKCLTERYEAMAGMEEQLAVLERKLPAILHIIADAEEKGAHQAGVGAWLRALKAVAYEANDVLDEFKYEQLRREAKKKGHYSKLGMDVVSLFASHNPIVFRYRMGNKLRKIVQAIEGLVKDMNEFGFRQQQQQPPSKHCRQTDSIIIDIEKDIVERSRDEEKKKIVQILLDQAGNRDLMVLPIVGMGGLGKTTFAQLVYNDNRIQKHFQLQRWICVSDDFDVVNLANNICDKEEKDREKALKKLQQEVSGKRFLIVLDDVWERDPDKWGKLKTCLQHGATGSAILTTTRDGQVARIMGTVKQHNLNSLEERFLKEIFERRAFGSQAQLRDKMVDIVDKIVNRCGGSPLAAKALGSVLSTKDSVEEWEAVLSKSSICNEENGILPILKISYDELPLHMKQCFAFCAMFPKDYEIDVEQLIQLWMANEFIPPQEEIHLETIGKQIFNELAWRSFFQDVKQIPLRRPYEPRRFERLCYRTTCKIHDLMHDIALSVMGKECVTITETSNHKKLLSNPTRHLFLPYRRIGTLMDDFLKEWSTTLHTLFYSSSIPYLSKNNSLRALRSFALGEFPFRPRQLQHLRYLDLSGNYDIKKIPEEISILYNLQTLNLSGCVNLVRLPRDMKYMTGLRHLYTNECISLKYMPPDLGQLTSLQTLTCFVVGASSGCSNIGELHNLSLGGELNLQCLENVTEAHAKVANFGNKGRLTHLSLEWNSDCHIKELDYHQKVLDALKPHGGLQMLRIVSYKSTGLPTWMKDLSLLQGLTEFHLVDCTICEEFPQFWYLKALQVLYLRGLDKLKSLCNNMASTAFPSLKKLTLYNLKSLERLVSMEERRGEEPTFPMLENIEIENCSKLTTLPEARKLKFLMLREDKPQLSLSIVKSRYMCSLSNLILCVNDSETTLQFDQNCLELVDGGEILNHEACLSKMTLHGCSFFFPTTPAQPIIRIWRWFVHLEVLTISSCDQLIYWPEKEFLSLVSLKRLNICYCKQLIGGPIQVEGEPTLARDQLLPQLETLYINDCGSLTELFDLPSSLRRIDIIECHSLEFIWGKKDRGSESVPVEHPNRFTTLEDCNDLLESSSLQEQSSITRNHFLPCLQYLYIFSCDNLVRVPNLPPSLKTLSISSCDELHFLSGQLDVLMNLSIYRCNKLESLEYLGNLPSLESFKLERCKHLISLPDGFGRYSVLRILIIKYCPIINIKSLHERLQQPFNNFEVRDLSNAHSSDPDEGPKLRDPKSWKYAFPGCKWGV